VGYRIRIAVTRVVWGMVFLAVLLAPLVLSARAGGRGDLVIELSLVFGLLAASVLVCAAVLPSRLRSLTNAFGIERVLRSHRWLGLLALNLVLVHLALVVIDDPSNLRLLNPFGAPNRARAATGATIALVLLCLFAVVRRRVHRTYEVWRWIHVGLALTVLVLSGLHIFWLNHLIRDPALRAGFVVASVLVLAVLANRWVLRPLLDYRHAFVVDGVRHESPTASTVLLRPLRHRHPGLHFSPGQFAWLRLDRPFGPREEHPFTIASGSHRPRELEFTVRHTGDFTGSLARLIPGRRVYVDGPYGAFTPDLLGRRGLLLVAGGVGITPMMSILRTLAHRRDRRPHRLVVGVRSDADLMFGDELARLQRRLRLSVIPVVSDPGPGWTGLVGRVDARLLGQLLPRRQHRQQVEVFICGPGPMVEGVVGALSTLGVPDRQVHTEQFDMV